MPNLAKTKLLIAAGGTGGHITPALAIAEAFEAAGGQVQWIGTHGGLESKMVPRKYRLRLVKFAGVVGGGLLAKVKMPFSLLRALWQTRAVFREVKPDLVLGMGGFPALPAGLYAWLSRTPLAIHEQNAVLGLSNQVLAKKADLRLSGFPKVFVDVPGGGVHVGNPVRASMTEVAAHRQDWSTRSGVLSLVVVGGSRGAKALNDLVPLAIAKIPLKLRPQVLHQTGANNQEVVAAKYQDLGIPAQVTEFIDDMAKVYQEADVLICRSGASTVAELAMVGMPALLVPYPYHSDQQQLKNANYLVDAGAAHVLPQADLTAETLAHAIMNLNRQQLATMSRAARVVAKDQVANQIVRHLFDLLGSPHNE